MTKGNIINRAGLINNVVRRLNKHGLEVRSTRIGNIRPVIEIERPQSFCPGFQITCKSNGIIQQMHVAKLGGCLITWRA
ncbi:hypothetical protein C942_00962 [Photobacterium marinum]|uniref:Uncharacterized protein n=1 Tax=Photobacterium marinum TaxID=1056511 RepID=L8JAI1_9GAMM|nr:hypothetical protein [Photobacterium marinum]ELR65875.1 hypothetical protein C942_00962 [Photobacterium marinum]